MTATLIGVGFLHEPWPRGIALCGALLVIVGIALFAGVVVRQQTASASTTRALRTGRGA